MWVVVSIRVPFWVLIVIRHRTIILTTTHVEGTMKKCNYQLFRPLYQVVCTCQEVASSRHSALDGRKIYDLVTVRSPLGFCIAADKPRGLAKTRNQLPEKSWIPQC